MIRRAARTVLLWGSAGYLSALVAAYLFGIAGIQRHRVETASYVFAAAVAAAFWLSSLTARPTDATSRAPDPLAAHPFRARAILFIAASFVLYSAALSLGLLSDDFVLVARAASGDWSAGEFFRPFPLALWWTVSTITSDAMALHAISVLLHGTNAALVARVGASAGLARGTATAAGILFLVFPAAIEAVAWPAAVQDLIVTACALLFVLATRGGMSRWAWLLATTTLAVALLSKESAVVIWIVALVMNLRVPRLRDTPGWPVIVSGIAACGAYAVWRVTYAPPDATYARLPGRYLAKELVGRTVGTLAVPWTTETMAAWPWVAAGGAIAIVIVTALYASRSGAAAPRRPARLTPSMFVRLLAAALVCVLPVYAFFYIGPGLENARYIYLPAAFWTIALAGAARDGLGGRGLLPPLALVAATAIGVAGVQRHLTAWRDAAALRDQVLAAADAVVASGDCASAWFSGAPDSLRGAYVFRNGLPEAVAARTAVRVAPSARECVFVWDGSQFRRATAAEQ